ncbi:MAG: hypothetical protein C5B54_10810 [Acidobacteria bacterium]|nr:MAG: hypothetical protein C5B54_10810 [Acidobacteriota bacterium]
MSDTKKMMLDHLRDKLLVLHKTLVDLERASYERIHGAKIAPGHFLNLLLEDKNYAWLRKISELIVWIDEVLDPKEPTAEEETNQIFEQARKLLNPSELGDDFVRKYQEALQRNADVIMAHKEVRDILRMVPKE